MALKICFPDGKVKALTLSYDDGVTEDERLISVMKEYGLRGTFNLNSGLYRTPDKARDLKPWANRFNYEEATATYAQDGIEPALHTLTHPFLNRLSPPELVYQILTDRLNLEKQFGHMVRGMAYPQGTVSATDDAVRVARDCGIVYSRTTASTQKFDLPTDWLRWNPTCHHKDPMLPELTDKFVNQSPAGIYGQTVWLFYLWGHAYEFASNNNWEIIENFAKTAGRHDDIWYATNFEIYQYVEAFRHLVVSPDCSAVFNPSCFPVFFSSGDQIYRIAPGETVKL